MRRKARPHEHQGEINIVPYLDIMVNLVMFMLMSMTGFVSFQMLNVNAPDVADAAMQADPTTPPPKDEQTFILNVSISERGFYVAATGGVLPGDSAEAAQAGPDSAEPTIPLKDGDYDYEALTRKMEEIKTAYPDKSQVILAADARVRYEVIVQAMDAMRGSTQRLLFPDVAFAAISN